MKIYPSQSSHSALIPKFIFFHLQQNMEAMGRKQRRRVGESGEGKLEITDEE